MSHEMPTELRRGEDSPFRKQPRHRADISALLVEQLENLGSFAPAPGGSVVLDVGLVVPAGKTFAVVGASGIGKSTVLNLLLSSGTRQIGVRETGENQLWLLDVFMPSETGAEILEKWREQPELPALPVVSISGTSLSKFQTSPHSDPPIPHVNAGDVWLAVALAELEQVDQEAAEEGFSLSNELSRGNARRILNKLARESSAAPTVYPTENGGIAILFQKRRTQAGVLILCEQDGSGACFSTIAGKKRRARYDDASDLPDAFVISELVKLQLA